MRADIAVWRTHRSSGDLRYARGRDGSLMLADTRADAPLRDIAMDSIEQVIYPACDDIADVHELCDLVSRNHPAEAREVDIVARLDGFVSRRLMVGRQDRYLSLALPEEPGWS